MNYFQGKILLSWKLESMGADDRLFFVELSFGLTLIQRFFTGKWSAKVNHPQNGSGLLCVTN